MKTPVVFLVFNRPQLTARVFARIREARPPQLLVVCDGPRAGFPEEPAKVAAVRRIVEGVDWPCEVRTNFSDENLGCRARVASGLDWAFSLVEEAIILEDDCLPDASFFPFCEELLARYREEPKVMHIGGNNFLGNRVALPASYAFSRYGHIWGWATWRRAWQGYESDAHSWKNAAIRQQVFAAMGLADERGYWGAIFEECATAPDAQTTWDFQWTLSCWRHSGLAIYPAVNLVENIGIGVEGTHPSETAHRLAVKASASPLPCTHPAAVRASAGLDKAIFYSAFMSPTPLASRVGRVVKHVRTLAGLKS